jgi:replicative DNA helicase
VTDVNTPSKIGRRRETALVALAVEAEQAPARGPAEYDRTPPQNIAAEQSVLGGMLLSKDAIADVVEALRPTDFYRPAHQIICEAILDLYGRGEPADAITVAAELIRNGNIARVGGANYLHTLMSSVPTAANAGYYAEIVAEQAILRRLVEAGTRIVQMGYGAAGGSADIAGSVDEVVDRAQAEVYDVTERRSSEDYVVIESLLQNTLDEIERIESNGGVGTGIPTGFSELDQLTNGLHPGQMITIAGRPGSGKALALDTPLPTPTGWTTMGAVAVGDLLIAADGRPTRVVAATDVLVGRPCFEVEFSDGTVIVADAQHEWRTRTRAQRRAVPEGRRAYYFPADVRCRAAAVVAAARRAGDSGVTVREMTALVGAELANVVSTEAYATTARVRLDRADVGVRRGSGPMAREYSLATLAQAVHARIDRPIRSAATAGVVTTERIAATLRCPTADRRLNHSVDCASPLALPTADLLVPPYTLGAWLGDGTSASASLTSADAQIVANIRADGILVTPVAGNLRYRLQLPKTQVSPRTCAVCGATFVPVLPHVRTCGRSCGGRFKGLGLPLPTCGRCGVSTHANHGYCRSCQKRTGTLQAQLRTLGVLGNKHIPAEYLRADEAQRRALLAGLLDTDGYVAPSGHVVFSVTSQRLAQDVFELIVSLGYRATVTTKSVAGRTFESSTAYSVAFTPAERVFGLDRKADRQVSHTRAGTRFRYVVDVRPIASVPVRCVQVDNDDHMYLASCAMIPTHNSTLALDIARSSAIKNGHATALFSLEMGKLEIMMRLFSAEARVLLNNMRSGKMSDEDWTRMARRSGELAQAPLYIDDSPNLTMMEIRAKARRLKQRHDLKLVVIDYLQLMTSGKRVESRQQEVSEFSRAIKLLAKELEVPVIALSQLNRSSEQRTDKKPMLSDLRESGSIEQDSDVVMLVHREDMYEPESPRAGEADIIIAKHRNGPTRTVTVAFQGHYSCFKDMAT